MVSCLGSQTPAIIHANAVLQSSKSNHSGCGDWAGGLGSLIELVLNSLHGGCVAELLVSQER